MKLRILGCGTSTGVPVIGCSCNVCTSTDPRNKRTRSSILVQAEGTNILIDTSTDLRAQSLANNVKRVDAVLFTHPHADHIHGIDDLRAFNMLKKGPIPCYGSADTLKRVGAIFEYIFLRDRYEGWKPDLTFSVIDSPLKVSGVEVIPFEVDHGESPVLGFRINGAAYITDCSGIPESTMPLLRGLRVMVIGALRHRPHPSHFSIDQAVEASRRVGPERTVLTHLSHNVDYVNDSKGLPPGVEFAYDGMEIEI
jgi:phosphoribosyl 1,2-cyclic phosphate phosphodiesterase